MNENLREQACWLLLTFESGLPTRIINDIILAWCQQLGRTLQEFFAADAQAWRNVCPWFVSRAMERNRVVTGLAQVVIVAEADTQGGTWEGANGALKQQRPLYVRQADDTSSPGTKH